MAAPLDEELVQQALCVFARLDADGSQMIEMSEFNEVFGTASLVTLNMLCSESGGAVSPVQWMQFLEKMQARHNVGYDGLCRFLKFCEDSLSRFEERRNLGLTKQQSHRATNLFNCMDGTGDNSGTIETEAFAHYCISTFSSHTICQNCLTVMHRRN